MVIPQIEEQYRCNYCEKTLTLLQISQSWKCPVCQKAVSIKVKADAYQYCCNRLQPAEIKPGYFLILNNQFRHLILTIEKTGIDYNLMLQGYGSLATAKDEYFLVIAGGWMSQPY